MVVIAAGMNTGIKAMTKELRTYLEWRWRVNTFWRYQQYRDEWINNLVPSQLYYFEKEMERMINNGQYK